MEKAGLFGTKAGPIYQSIDTQKLTLQNLITFPPTGAFAVDSTIELVGAQVIRSLAKRAVLS